MSEDIIAFLLSLGIVVALVLWLPALHLVCPPCSRLVRSFRARKRTLPHAAKSNGDPAKAA